MVPARAFVVVFLVFFASSPVATLAQDGNTPPWPVTRFPFVPRVTDGEANPVCEVLAQAAKKAFFSPRFNIDLYEFLPSSTKLVAWEVLKPPFSTDTSDELS